MNNDLDQGVHMSRTARIGQVVLVVLSALCVLIAFSVLFVEDPFERDAQILIASFGGAMGVLAMSLAIVGLNKRQNWAWATLWVLPVFFASHAVALGTWIPDGVFAVVAAVALGTTRQQGARASV